LFAACLIPGLLLAALYGLYVLFAFPGDKAPAATQPVSRISAIGLLAPFALIILVLGSILAGVATPNEAAACGAAGALALALVRAPHSVVAGLAEAVRLTGAIFAIVIAASIVALVLRGLGADDATTGWLSVQTAHGALVGVMVVIFLLGFVIEFVEIVFIVIPIAAPPLLAAGVDPIWFAALVALNLQTSFLTPPFGLSLFYLRAAAPQVPFFTLVRGVVPFILLQLLALALVALVPALATWLPALLFSTPGG
jgi:TRAP-type mannitol/chloroaromatic compound transport system permease large subunit